jgi:hypothetical protein
MTTDNLPTPIFPSDPVPIDLGDGVARSLRYTLASLRRLKAKHGASLLTGAALKALDEDVLPDLLYEGLTDRRGIESAEALADKLTPSQVPYLIDVFGRAFSGSLPVPDPNAPSSSQKE